MDRRSITRDEFLATAWREDIALAFAEWYNLPRMRLADGSLDLNEYAHLLFPRTTRRQLSIPIALPPYINWRAKSQYTPADHDTTRDDEECDLEIVAAPRAAPVSQALEPFAIEDDDFPEAVTHSDTHLDNSNSKSGSECDLLLLPLPTIDHTTSFSAAQTIIEAQRDALYVEYAALATAMGRLAARVGGVRQNVRRIQEAQMENTEEDKDPDVLEGTTHAIEEGDELVNDPDINPEARQDIRGDRSSVHPDDRESDVLGNDELAEDDLDAAGDYEYNSRSYGEGSGSPLFSEDHSLLYSRDDPEEHGYDQDEDVDESYALDEDSVVEAPSRFNGGRDQEEDDEVVDGNRKLIDETAGEMVCDDERSIQEPCASTSAVEEDIHSEEVSNITQGEFMAVDMRKGELNVLTNGPSEIAQVTPLGALQPVNTLDESHSLASTLSRPVTEGDLIISAVTTTARNALPTRVSAKRELESDSYAAPSKRAKSLHPALVSQFGGPASSRPVAQRRVTLDPSRPTFVAPHYPGSLRTASGLGGRSGSQLAYDSASQSQSQSIPSTSQSQNSLKRARDESEDDTPKKVTRPWRLPRISSLWPFSSPVLDLLAPGPRSASAGPAGRGSGLAGVSQMGGNGVASGSGGSGGAQSKLSTPVVIGSRRKRNLHNGEAEQEVWLTPQRIPMGLTGSEVIDLTTSP